LSFTLLFLLYSNSNRPFLHNYREELGKTKLNNFVGLTEKGEGRLKIHVFDIRPDSFLW
jgi:hypothetical protein